MIASRLMIQARAVFAVVPLREKCVSLIFLFEWKWKVLLNLNITHNTTKYASDQC